MRTIKPEALFESHMKNTAPLVGCLYIKIPDTQMLNRNNRYDHKEKKRPFDGIIVTPTGNWCVELKYGYPKLMPHQKQNQDRINEINRSFIVIRKIKRIQFKHKYRLEFHDGRIETEKIEEIFKIIIEIRSE
jgi:hypothetical protein